MNSSRAKQSNSQKSPLVSPHTSRIADAAISGELNLSDLGLSSLPSEALQYQNSKYLDLSKNQFTAFPVEVLNLRQLETLILSDNEIAEVPSEIHSLTRLKKLSLAKNPISTLPKEIGRLRELKSLDLNTMSLANLPAAIQNLNLDFLDIGNDFSYVEHAINIRLDEYDKPFEFTTVDLIKTFMGLRGELPIFHKEEFQYESPILNNEKFEGLWKKLDEWGIKEAFLGNQLSIPPEITEKINEPQAILNYYFQIFPTRKNDGEFDDSESLDQKIIIGEKKVLVGRSVNQIKLLTVGQGSVGKTSLIQQILHSTFDQNQTKTEGIAINQWQIQVNNKWEDENESKSEIKVNIWDFGGQEIMHATHQFFLTKRSLYLLVLDTRLTQEENRVEYWLKIIQSFGGESPVLIIGNKTDQHPLDIDRTGLKKKYLNIVGILETSAATGAGIEELKAEIAKQVDTLPHVRDLLPETWFTVKSKLEELGRDKNFITQDEYLSLCETNDVVDETSQHTLIGFLHDLGIVLHFQDDPRLVALGILNPQWVTNGVYKILNSLELFQNQGTLTLSILNETLNLPEYPSNKRLFIVDMMKKFELCYDIVPNESFLIPDLLPNDEPFTGEWDGTLSFQFHYNVLPTSIISRFIVRMNAFVHKTVWRSGVVLKSGGNTALVKADTEDRKIYIWVTGDENTRRDFLSAIRMEFDAIHKTIVKIEATEKVPLQTHPQVAPVDYEFLLRLERDNRPTFPVQAGNDIIDVDVKELLDGVRPSKHQAVKVFISYAHKDKSFAKKLAGELEDADIKVWWDFDSLKGGQDWQKEIERGIKQCNFFLVILSPDAVDSEWVGNEITYASQAQKEIIPLHLKKCDIPIGLIKKQYIDFERQTKKAAIEELKDLIKLAYHKNSGITEISN